MRTHLSCLKAAPIQPFTNNQIDEQSLLELGLFSPVLSLFLLSRIVSTGEEQRGSGNQQNESLYKVRSM